MYDDKIVVQKISSSGYMQNKIKFFAAVLDMTSGFNFRVDFFSGRWGKIEPFYHLEGRNGTNWSNMRPWGHHTQIKIKDFPVVQLYLSASQVSKINPAFFAS